MPRNLLQLFKPASPKLLPSHAQYFPWNPQDRFLTLIPWLPLSPTEPWCLSRQPSVPHLLFLGNCEYDFKNMYNIIYIYIYIYILVTQSCLTLQSHGL